MFSVSTFSTDVLIEGGLVAVSLGPWFVAYWVARLLTRPAHVAPGAATMDFPGAEPPAVVSLLANRWQPTVDAAESTLLDLAARGYLEFDQAGPDPRHTLVRLTGRAPTDLNPYERQVYDRVAQRAKGGVVPLTALGFSDAREAGAWARRLHRLVVADARARGLSRARFSKSIIGVLSAWAIVAASGVTLAAAHYIHRDDDKEYLAVLGAFAITFGALTTIAGGVKGERDTPAGRACAAGWLGVRAWLAGHESFADQPPAAVEVWDRYLSYGAAVGVTRVASQVIDLGMADRKHIWSSYGGGWRQVTVSYPTAFPRYGQGLGWITFRAIAAFWLGVLVVETSDLGQATGDQELGKRLFLLITVLLFGYAAYTLLRVVLEVTTPVTVRGEVLWRQVWKTKSVGDEDHSRTEPVNYHLVVDDGRADRTRAWILLAEDADGCRTGDEVEVRARRWTRRVRKLTVLQRGAGWSGAQDGTPPSDGTPTGRADLPPLWALRLAQRLAERPGGPGWPPPGVRLPPGFPPPPRRDDAVD